MTVTAGLALGVVTLAIGLTGMAQGAQVERAGAVAIAVALVVALVGFYFVAVGLWAGWSPATARLRVRSFRILLSWVVLESTLFCLALPLTAPSAMTRSEWVSLAALMGYFVIALTSMAAIVRKPRQTVILIGLAAASAVATLAYGAWTAFASGADRFSGPAGALSFVLAGSLCVAILGAFMLAWPLRAGEREGRRD